MRSLAEGSGPPVSRPRPARRGAAPRRTTRGPRGSGGPARRTAAPHRARRRPSRGGAGIRASQATSSSASAWTEKSGAGRPRPGRARTGRGSSPACTLGELPAPGALGLVAGQHHAVAWVGELVRRWCTTRPPVAIPEAEIMMHGSPARSAAGGRCIADRDDVAGIAQRSAGGPCRCPDVRGAPVDVERRQRHRAVDVDRDTGIRPASRSRRSSSSTSSVRSTANAGTSTVPPRPPSGSRRPPAAHRVAGAAPVAVGRLHDDRVGPRGVSGGRAADGGAGRGRR